MSVMPYVSLNFSIQSADSLKFPYDDYGFLYGYGLFESIRIFNKQPLLFEQHMARLQQGDIILDIGFPVSTHIIRDAITNLVEKNNVENAILNIYLTLGDRGADVTKFQKTEPMFLMVLRPWPNHDRRARVKLDCRPESFQRTPLDQFKTLSWMKNVMENRLSPDFDDVLLYTANGQILETSRANVFFVKGRTLVTPKSSSILKGVVRQYLLEEQKNLGFEVVMEPLYMDALGDFDEIFLTNAGRGVFFVSEVNGYPGLNSGIISSAVQESFLRQQKLI